MSTTFSGTSLVPATARARAVSCRRLALLRCSFRGAEAQERVSAQCGLARMVQRLLMVMALFRLRGCCRPWLAPRACMMGCVVAHRRTLCALRWLATRWSTWPGAWWTLCSRPRTLGAPLVLQAKGFHRCMGRSGWNNTRRPVMARPVAPVVEVVRPRACQQCVVLASCPIGLHSPGRTVAGGERLTSRVVDWRASCRAAEHR